MTQLLHPHLYDEQMLWTLRVFEDTRESEPTVEEWCAWYGDGCLPIAGTELYPGTSDVVKRILPLEGWTHATLYICEMWSPGFGGHCWKNHTWLDLRTACVARICPFTSI